MKSRRETVGARPRDDDAPLASGARAPLLDARAALVAPFELRVIDTGRSHTGDELGDTRGVKRRRAAGSTDEDEDEDEAMGDYRDHLRVMRRARVIVSVCGSAWGNAFWVDAGAPGVHFVELNNLHGRASFVKMHHYVGGPSRYWVLEPRFGTPTTSAILAFALLLLIPYAAMKLIASLVGGKARESLLGPLDRVLGFGFGALKGAIIVVVAFSLLVLGYDTVWGAQGRPTWIQNARTYPSINAGSEQMVGYIRERRARLKEEESGAGEPEDSAVTSASASE